jgi:peroxiredoxin
VSDTRKTDNLEQAFVEHAARLAAMTFPDALQVGEKASNFELPNARGQNVELNSLLANGPVVLVFYRGAWCPYCNAQLRALQESLEEITSFGATLVAVSPQAPDASAAFADVAGLSFEVLSDLGSFVASDYGLSFELAEPDRALFLAVGNDLTKVNGSDSWILPVPAIYVVATDGADQTRRGQPKLCRASAGQRDHGGASRGQASINRTKVLRVSSSRGSFRRAAWPNICR